MPEWIPDNIRRLSPYVPGRPISEVEREYGVESPIKLASNECARPPSPAVAAAIAGALGDLQRYPDPTHYDLRHALANHWGIPADEFVFGNGSNELLDLIVRTFSSRADHLIFGDPSFVSYRIAAEAHDVAYTAVPLTDALSWDVDALLAAVRPETRVMLIANPNNPTGAMIASDGLRRLLGELPPHVVPVLDEAYAEFVTDADYESALEMRDLHPRLIVLRTFSKAYGLASLRVGYGVASAEMIGWIERLRAPFNVNALAHVGAMAALDDGAYLAQTVEENAAERERIRTALGALGLATPASHTNFLLVPLPPGRASHEVHELMLRRGVILRAFGPPLERFLRVTLGTPEENDVMVAAFAQLYASRATPSHSAT